MPRSRSVMFDVFPKVVAADSAGTITIRPLDSSVAFDAALPWFVQAVSREEAIDRTNDETVGARPAPEVRDGTMRLTFRFTGEQEHRFVVKYLADGRHVEAGTFNVYSLAEDLHERRPLRGDLHLHSNFSDGKTSPAYVAARGREIGLDFLALTDHHDYAGSLAAIEAFKDVPIDLRLLPGEEIHPPGNWVHMVNFGGSVSVNALIGDNRDAYDAAVAEIAGSITGMDGLARTQYASCRWVYDRIRDGGGLAVLCHPFWNYWHAFNLSDRELTAHLAEWPCDAVELLGGFPPEDIEPNMLMLARWQQARVGTDRPLSVVAASDAHDPDGDLFGWFSTIVFSPSDDPAELVTAIRDGWSVAVETYPNQPPRVYGPCRLVKFAYFLLREMFPAHDALCVEQGRLMRAHAAGDAQASKDLARLQGRTAALMDHIWA